MEPKLTIGAITPTTRDWTSKVQVIDNIRPKISKDQRTRFQTIIVQDENEEQICIIIYGPDIPEYEKLEMFKPFHTYVISGAKVRQPSAYAIRLNRYEWIVDSYTIVEEVAENNDEETILPVPIRLDTISFFDIEQQTRNVEIDLLAAVVNCATMKYLDDDRRRQDAIVIDDKRKPFMFTIWGELADHEGKELLEKLEEYPVILAKRVAVTNYRGCQLATRFNSTIHIDPPYHQAKELMNWAKDNKEMLIAYTLKSSSDTPSELNLAPFEDEILPISSISSESSDQTFFVQGEISLPDEFQFFYILVCPECRHPVRHRKKKCVKCMHCKQRGLFIPRCEFDVEITDGSGTITASFSGNLTEEMLPMTASEIYETTIVKNQSMPVEHIREQLWGKTFQVQLQKSVSKTPDKMPGALVVLSYSRIHTMFDLPECSTPTTTISEGTKRNIESTTSSGKDHTSSTKIASSSKKQKTELPTPRRKQ